MKDFFEKSLMEILDEDDFMTVQDELSNLLQFSVITINPDGTPIGHWNNFTEFCGLIRSSPIGAQNCMECDRQASLRALKCSTPQSYLCHCGLHDCAAPIIVENQYLGSVLGGQVFTHESERSNVDTRSISSKFNISEKKLQNALSKIAIVPEEYLQRCIKFYSFMSSYLAEMSIQKVIQEHLTKETNKNLQLQQIVKKQELKRMQAQMNPHFLFNALNSIARMAMQEDAPKAEQLIYELADYLRYTIKNTSDMPTLEKELNNLFHYIAIQKIRFGDRITFIIDIDSSLLEYKIPSMILQPIVENSIIHGLESLKEGGYVKVIGKKIVETSEFQLLIIDNGIGFPPNILELFNNKIPFKDNYIGLGLINTHIRIKHLFGESYGIIISNNPFVENCVSIKLPCSL
ncbi:MAG: PocR ligand-binding domain-containing protein [Clostridia bacterium]|nr:PocR ligand-binding domain-containing protein [Clostridia bacterium]